jgi:hypothetical protein
MLTSADYPASLLKRDLPLLALVGLALINGTTYSPIYDSVSYFLYNFARRSPFFSPGLLYYVTSLQISVLTVMVAGIPAALYERIRGLQRSTPASLGIWLIVTLLLTLPTLRAVLAED